MSRPVCLYAQAVEAYTPLVRKIASVNYQATLSSRTRGHYQDVEQEAFIALLAAIRGYNPARSSSFTNYAYKKVNATVRKRLTTKDYKDLFLSDVSTGNDSAEDKGIYAFSVESFEAEVDRKIQLEQVFSRISEKDRTYLTERYIEGKTYREIGESQGVTYQGAEYNVRKSLARAQRRI